MGGEIPSRNSRKENHARNGARLHICCPKGVGPIVKKRTYMGDILVLLGNIEHRVE